VSAGELIVPVIAGELIVYDTLQVIRAQSRLNWNSLKHCVSTTSTRTQNSSFMVGGLID